MARKNSEINRGIARIAVIILNWKNIETTVQCVESVARSRKVIPEIFLLDNETNEIAFKELKERLSENDLKINFFASYQNLGFAGGINYVLNQINLDKFVAIFLLNNDAKINSDTLHKLYGESRTKDIQLLGPRNLSSNTRPSRRWPWWLFGFKFPQKYNDSKKVWPTCYLDGSGLFITNDLSKKILTKRGCLFNNAYFLYGEDTELGLYAKKIGAPPYITSEATMIHKRGSYKTEARRALTYYYTTRNRVFLAKDYLSAFLKPLFYVYYPISRFLIIIYRLIRGENKLAFAIVEGLRDGCRKKYGKWIKHP